MSKQGVPAITLPLRWGNVDSFPVPQFANVVVVNKGPTEEIVVTFATAAPILVGTLEEQGRQVKHLEGLGGVPTHIVSRLSLTTGAAKALYDALGVQLNVD